MSKRRSPPRRLRTRHVALVFPMVEAHLQHVVQGITDWIKDHESWRLTTLAEPLGPSFQTIGWQGDGVIAALTSDAEIEAARELALPCVNISSATSDRTFPRVNIDNAAVGRLAAEHLLAHGFRRVAYFGVRGISYSDEREAAFVKRLRQERTPCEIDARYAEPSGLDRTTAGEDDRESIVKWLAKIQRPFAVFAVNDAHARKIVSACQMARLRVPEDVAVLGVDNDLVTCESAAPSLSSIACDWRRIGYEAAAALQREMVGEPPTIANLPIAPIGIVGRRSTDATVVEHPGVAAAMDYVRQNIGQVFGVEALIHVSHMPRRSLEIAFAQSLGCTPYEHITRARVARAKELLVAPLVQTLSQISRACGFSDLRRFRMVFKREVGMTPAQYRLAERQY